MISLSGSTRATSGTTFCVTASNVSGPLTVQAYIRGTLVSHSVSYDNQTHKATICVKVPRGARGGIAILVANGSVATYTSHNALIRR